MPYTNAKEYMKAYSGNPSTDIKQALQNAIEKRFRETENVGDLEFFYDDHIQENLWKLDTNGVMSKVPYDDGFSDRVTADLANGVVYVIPDVGSDGQPNFNNMVALTATRDEDGLYHVQMLDAQQAKDAYDNRPQSSEPTVIDKIVDFFCRLVGSRGAVCALWDEVNAARAAADRIQQASQIYAPLTEDSEKKLTEELLGKEFDGQRRELSGDEKNQRIGEARDLLQKNAPLYMDRFDPELADWYLALYNRTHDLFPTYISENTEVDMTRMDQQALNIASGKLTYKEYKPDMSEPGKHCYYNRCLDTLAYNSFDVRANLVTTMAFALTAEQGMSAEDVFKFLAGEKVAGTEGLMERLNEEMAKFNNPETRNGDDVKQMIQAGTQRMCQLLEGQQDLQSAVSYQLGRTLQRNMIAFGGYDPESTMPNDPQTDLKLSPMARDIVQLQDAVITSYNTVLMEGFALNGAKNGKIETLLHAKSFLPMVAQGHTNAAFLEKLSEQPVDQRLVFLKTSMRVLNEMNENMRGFVVSRLNDPNCTWTDSPENLKSAINGGVVKEYQQEVTRSLQESGKMPDYKAEFELTTMDLNGSFSLG